MHMESLLMKRERKLTFVVVRLQELRKLLESLVGYLALGL